MAIDLQPVDLFAISMNTPHPGHPTAPKFQNRPEPQAEISACLLTDRTRRPYERHDP
ncbi:hypothetical protein [Paraburkholderia hiiakae]|uniref:hypothetical protein n=1 Tax=Paraburkholderia hiiakae TaxID=1081782 RepID=UPI00191AED6D|nr:hypothetical protein [Paraburkholderia hiiakae]